MIRRARAQVSQASAGVLPFEMHSFDKTYAVNSFQFWPQSQEGLAELARVLKPGGRLVIVQRAAGPGTTSNFVGAQGGWEWVERAVEAAKQAGFQVVDVTQEPAGKLVAGFREARTRSPGGPGPRGRAAGRQLHNVTSSRPCAGIRWRGVRERSRRKAGMTPV